MGVPAGPPKGVRRPSHAAYYVALVGVLSLLLLLCLYFFYYFIKKVKELSSAESLSLPGTSCRPPATTTYPVQPVVRDSATAMAKLCRAVPAAGKGDTVFPTSTSPAALRTDTGAPAGPPSGLPPGLPAGLPAGPPAAPPAGPPEPAPAGADPPPDKPPPAPVVPVAATVEVAAR
ncbi:WW domain-binding protein 11-like [Trichoplusia ni]|uniref:WW domain-binding protein 11-like n=1 Tax=Trichoplusia ni TaxID=7111 RepID=A0A7E5W5X1_TRINI|nr:WW domain-binding protein 11-like [Trichoplusia ni]